MVDLFLSCSFRVYERICSYFESDPNCNLEKLKPVVKIEESEKNYAA